MRYSNQGKSFEGGLWKSLGSLYGTEKSWTTLYHPEGNGQSERFIWTLHELFYTFPQEKKRKWPKYLPQGFCAYNTMGNQSTGNSPYKFIVWSVGPTACGFSVECMKGETHAQVSTGLDGWTSKSSVYLCVRGEQLKQAPDHRNLHEQATATSLLAPRTPGIISP